mmetsp:Transcript_3954/g.5255  ORF Transcript_3954/g.5255 Transcript_3954/m.5255 type:complete len:225 (+) Transcript_3954:97-771(+)
MTPIRGHSRGFLLPDLLEGFQRLRALRIDLEHVLERGYGFVELREGLVDASEAQVRIHVRVVQTNRTLVVLDRLLVLAKVVVRARQVEVALGGGVVDRQRLQISAYTFLELVEHVERVSEVIVGRRVVSIQVDGVLVGFDGLIVLRLNAQGVAEVVVRLRLLRVQLDGRLVVLDGLLDHFVEVQRVAEVIMDIAKMVVDRQSLPVELDGLVRLACVVICIAETD